MNYSKILKCDIANDCGNGWGVTLFVSGCSHGCKGCFNPETHNPDYGKPFDRQAKEILFNALSEPICDSVTFTGGDPMFCSNRSEVINLSKEIGQLFPNIVQVLYTGYTMEELMSDQSMKPILNSVNVVVDGEFVEGLRDMGLKFRGSSNQRIWKKSSDGCWTH